jgi:hypothetical protein
VETAEELCRRNGVPLEDKQTPSRYVEELTALAMNFGTHTCYSAFFDWVQESHLNSEVHLFVAAIYTDSITVIREMMPRAIGLLFRDPAEFDRVYSRNPGLTFQHFNSFIFGDTIKIAAAHGKSEAIEAIFDVMMDSPSFPDADVKYLQYFAAFEAYQHGQSDLFIWLLSDRFSPWRPLEEEKDYLVEYNLNLADVLLNIHPSALVTRRRAVQGYVETCMKYKAFQDSNPENLKRFPRHVPIYLLDRVHNKLVEHDYKPRRTNFLDELKDIGKLGDTNLFEYHVKEWKQKNKQDAAGQGPWSKELIRLFCNRGNIEPLNMLLKDKKRFPPNTGAISQAAQGGHWNIVRILVENGFDVNEAPGEELPAIVYAVQVENETMFHYLRSYGAVVDTPAMKIQAARAKTAGLESTLIQLSQAGMNVDVDPIPIPSHKFCRQYQMREAAKECNYSRSDFNPYDF